MNERRMRIQDKEKMYKSFEIAIKVLSLFKIGEEITSKVLSERSKEINHGYSFKINAINRVLNNVLKDKVKTCGKNKWRLI